MCCRDTCSYEPTHTCSLYPAPAFSDPCQGTASVSLGTSKYLFAEYSSRVFMSAQSLSLAPLRRPNCQKYPRKVPEFKRVQNDVRVARAFPSENRSFLKEMAFLNVLTVAFTSGLFRSGIVRSLRSLGFFFPYYQIGVYQVHEGIACGKHLHLLNESWNLTSSSVRTSPRVFFFFFFLLT